jgi:hypothetical protein
LFFFPDDTWQVQLDRSALAGLAVDPDVTARLLGKPVNHAESQAAALAYRLRGEERVERAGPYFLTHAVPGIGDCQHHVLAGADFGIGRGIFLIEIEIGRLDGQPAAVRHGISPVDHEV